MKKYKIEYTQTEHYIMDVLATSQEEAERMAEEAWNVGNYQETGDIKVSRGNVYDVTDTEDPFYPINEDTINLTK